MKITHILIAALLFSGCSKGSDAIGDDKTPEDKEGAQAWPAQSELPKVTGEAVFNASGTDTYVNVMGNTQARIPNYPSLTLKKGVLRGFVADLTGKPLKNAFIGIRSTVGGTEGASAYTNDNGYYEISLPYGAITYYAAGYELNYGGGKAVVGLTPADGKWEGFASETGQVKNFVLLSYGLGQASELASRPSDQGNYYGGSLYIDYNVDYNDGSPLPYKVKIGQVVEITLTPDGPGLYGETRKFKIKKTVGLGFFANVVNIPIGKYTITAKMQDGRILKMSESGSNKHSWPHLGLKPDETTGPSTILFTPVRQRTVNMATAGYSNWQKLTVLFEPM